MKSLTYKTLAELNEKDFLLKEAPVRILQFGEGNFLRAFADYFVDIMNENADFNTKITLVTPLGKDTATLINQQEGLYTLYLRGFQRGKKVNKKRVISAVKNCLNPYADFAAFLGCAKNPDLRFILSNTTEAGIVFDPTCKLEDAPAQSFPGKLTQLLYKRFQLFGSKKGKGFVILPCELIEDNGKELKNCVLKYAKLWRLEPAFVKWLEDENIFCSTLVDRIVTGFPRNEADSLNKENGYVDNLLDTAEVFGFWVIEGPESLKSELPFEKAALPVLITTDHKPYKQRKVRILNGAHTTMVLGAYLAGEDIVRDCMNNTVINNFMNKAIYDEIIPTLTLPKQELTDFAARVTERFKNPFIDHELLSIALNSTAKWKARVLPSLKGYLGNTGSPPPCLTASFAFYIHFYNGFKMTKAGLIGKRENQEYLIKDDLNVLEFFLAHKDDLTKDLAHAVCSNSDFWGEDLSKLKGFEDKVVFYLDEIAKKGTYEVMKNCLYEK